MTYISVKEAAELVGKNERTIRRWIKSGKIKHVLIRGKYHLIEDSLQNFGVLDRKNTSTKNGKKMVEENKINNVSTTVPNREERNQINEQGNMSEKMSDNLENISVDRVQLINNIDKKNEKNREPKTVVTGTKIRTNPIMEEGVEYFLDKKMSDFGKNNMSVNIMEEDNIGSTISSFRTVEMSNNPKKNMSDSIYLSEHEHFDDKTNVHMSGFKTGLSTNSDYHVDKIFDDDGNIISSGNNIVGQFDKYSGHLDRTLGMSAFAVRLIEEKEKMSEKYREENSWLRTQIIELKNELSIMRGEIIAESNNRAKISDFLIESNKFWQERSVENFEKKNNFENKQKGRRYDFNRVSGKEDVNEIGVRRAETIYRGFWFGWLLMWVGIFLLVLVVFFYNFFFSIFL